ncbi:unnamed protein product [Medioppia subpectinata]|uniref:Uncharacterized protein n=1 Tax=Medioppia subpectinata TaxID=1979941 RepID=A0A7R9KYV3_9ACAR|nr:unnamed protein product [Medioppia subpectinata]CAG2112432.1 unnamed protein product [Medioppia subpectinata]
MNELRDELIDRKRLADDQKEIGNKHFKSGHIEESIKCYTNAIQLYESNPVFYCNRSMAYLKKGLPLEAHRDCDLALNIDNTCIKALYRRGLSRRQLFRYSLALDDFRRVLTLDADNSDAKRELAATQRLIQSKAIVEIKAIDKPLELQSKTPLTKVAICCDKKSCEFVVQLPESSTIKTQLFANDWARRHSTSLDVDIRAANDI